MRWIFAHWVGFTILAIADGVVEVSEIFDRVGLSLCGKARDNGYDFTVRMPPPIEPEPEPDVLTTFT